MSPAPPVSGEPAGYGKAAKRLSGWAANLFASALILVAGLALGRQVLEWWQADSPEATENRAALLPDAGELGDPERSHRIEFGDIPISMHRETLTGDKAAAFDALKARCWRAVDQQIEPRGNAGPAERRMLNQIGELQPTVFETGRWEIYELDGPLLLVAGIQFFPTEDRLSSERRVVFWGLAMPQGADYSEKATSWTLFSCQPALGASKASAIALVPLPKSAKVTLSLTAEDGESFVGFRAGGDSLLLSRQIELGLSKEGWKSAGPWRQMGDTWQGRFERQGQGAQVQWKLEAGGALFGVVTVTPNK